MIVSAQYTTIVQTECSMWCASADDTTKNLREARGMNSKCDTRTEDGGWVGSKVESKIHFAAARYGTGPTPATPRGVRS